MHLVIFEGTCWKNFAPISLNRPVFMLAAGMTSLLEKQIRYFSPARLTLWVRPEWEEYCRQRIVPKMSVPTSVNEPLDDQPALLVNGRTLQLHPFTPPQHESVDKVIENGQEQVAIALVKSPGLSPADPLNHTPKYLQILTLSPMEPQSRLASSPWDLIHWNEESLIVDSEHYRHQYRPAPVGPFHCVNPDQVLIAPDAHIAPGCVLDASKGPIMIDEHAAIGANSVIEGPSYIAPHASIRPISLIRSGNSIGPLCKVGGEIASSILLSCSNKVHDGFLGHSYLGQWVNLGAGTTTSNLKNTYGEISMKLGSREIPTGRRFNGALVGDHSKTAILTRFMSGTYIGFCCMLAGNGSVPRFVPSFTFWTDKKNEPYQLTKATEVIRRVYARRNRQWTPLDDQRLQYVLQAAPGVENI